jgi:hypothetical protein
MWRAIPAAAISSAASDANRAIINQRIRDELPKNNRACRPEIERPGGPIGYPPVPGPVPVGIFTEANSQSR